MTLKQAHQSFTSAAPCNVTLASRYRNEWHAVFYPYEDTPLEALTAERLRQIIGALEKTREQKARALSFLQNILVWLADTYPLQYHRPEWKFSDILKEEASSSPELFDDTLNPPPSSLHQIPESPVCCDSVATVPPTEATPPAEKENKKHKRPLNSGMKPKPVVMLDPQNLTVLRTFASLTEVTQQMGINQSNISKAISRKSSSAGYYWCYQGDEDSFLPAKKVYIRIMPKATGETAKNPAKEAVRIGSPLPSLSSFTDQQLRDELVRRGWHGSIYQRLDLL